MIQDLQSVLRMLAVMQALSPKENPEDRPNWKVMDFLEMGSLEDLALHYPMVGPWVTEHGANGEPIQVCEVLIDTNAVEPDYVEDGHNHPENRLPGRDDEPLRVALTFQMKARQDFGWAEIIKTDIVLTKPFDGPVRIQHDDSASEDIETMIVNIEKLKTKH